MTWCAGIDAGSRAVKVVVLEAETRRIRACTLHDQGVHQDELAVSLLDSAAAEAGTTRDGLTTIVATGYGRNRLDLASRTVTEITCHARGVFHQHPEAATVIDIGGQDSKLLRLEQDGRVRDFVMNDRCAAGTGRFLEVVADRLEVPLDSLGELASQADHPASISSMCVVFAESEIIGLLAAGESPANIVAGVQASIASRLMAMAGSLPAPPIRFTGGVALVPGMAGALATALGHPVEPADKPQYTGALGAALIAADPFAGG